MIPLEIEVKFYVPDPDVIRGKISESGAQYRAGTFERNIRFEDPEFSLFKKKALLRLRKTDSKAELTYKAEPPEKNRDFKIHRELEITVSNFETAKAILCELGLHEQQVYEKYRETWSLKDAVICLDRMPFGYFLEIEGRREEIREVADSLGLDWDRRILANYLAIFERLKKECELSFTDVTFENFRGVDLDFAGFAGLFESGPGTGDQV